MKKLKMDNETRKMFQPTDKEFNELFHESIDELNGKNINKDNNAKVNNTDIRESFEQMTGTRGGGSNRNQILVGKVKLSNIPLYTTTKTSEEKERAIRGAKLFGYKNSKRYYKKREKTSILQINEKDNNKKEDIEKKNVSERSVEVHKKKIQPRSRNLKDLGEPYIDFALEKIRFDEYIKIRGNRSYCVGGHELNRNANKKNSYSRSNLDER